jgi:excinuclease ABC subunit B
VLLYADVMTNSLRVAIEETERRRNKQRTWNEDHGITPISIRRNIGNVLESVFEQDYITVSPVAGSDTKEFVGKDLKASIADLEKRMRSAAADLEFEQAARLRDEIKRLEALELGLPAPPVATATTRMNKSRGPEPMGPGGGGYDPSKRRGRSGMRRRGP